MDGYGDYYSSGSYYSYGDQGGGYGYGQGYGQNYAQDYGYSDPYPAADQYYGGGGGYYADQRYSSESRHYRDYDYDNYYDDRRGRNRWDEGGYVPRAEWDEGNYGRGYSDWNDYDYGRSTPTRRDRRDSRNRYDSDYYESDGYDTDMTDKSRDLVVPPSPPKRKSRPRSPSASVCNPDDTASRIDPVRAKATPSDSRTVKMGGFSDPRDDETATVVSQRTVKTIMPRTHYVDKYGKRRKLTRKQMREMYFGVNQSGRFKDQLKKNSRHRGVCTQSDKDDKVHYVPPYPMDVPVHVARSSIQRIMTKQMPEGGKRTRLTAQKADYLRFEVMSKKTDMMGNIDDVEFYFNKFDHMIHCKSVTRSVTNDRGKNKERVLRVWALYRQDQAAATALKQDHSLAAQERRRERSSSRRKHHSHGYNVPPSPQPTPPRRSSSYQQPPLVVDDRRYDAAPVVVDDDFAYSNNSKYYPPPPQQAY
eukprot:NODE_25_length_2622_cov_368.119840_g24_i0.p1 GENE.NODE_25_length_2622_cov_368.119840_g24_i0~~NODE_25_length_2622_cov_368.119840_g24_i0.p1  ORF type:complete len:475 (-),score=103.17 NODE_25_length_2622_cov_368.119840_g24_i0:1118-2542(-)